MHIIFFILKLIGIILATLIGLILLLLLIILLVPIRYRVNAEQDEHFHAEAKVSWLLRIIYLRVNYVDNHLVIVVRIFGKIIYHSDLADDDGDKPDDNVTKTEFIRKRQKSKINRKSLISKKQKKNKKVVTFKEEKKQKVTDIQKETVIKKEIDIQKETVIPKEIDTDRYALIQKEIRTVKEEKIIIQKEASNHEYSKDSNDKVEISNIESIEKNSQKETNLKIEEESRKENVPLYTNKSQSVKMNIQDKDIKVGQESKKSSSKTAKFFGKIKSFFLNIKDSFIKFKNRILNITEKINILKEKWHKIKAFIKDEVNKAGISTTLKSLLNILKHIRPRKLKVELEIGTGDPCSTGQVLGALSVFYGYYGKSIQLIPNFNESVLKGTIFCIGRIRLLTLLIICIKLILDKKFKQLMNNFKVLKEEL